MSDTYTNGKMETPNENAIIMAFLRPPTNEVLTAPPYVEGFRAVGRNTPPEKKPW